MNLFSGLGRPQPGALSARIHQGLYSLLQRFQPRQPLIPTQLPPRAEPATRAQVEAELAALPGRRQLVRQGQWEVYGVKAHHLPHTLRELQRLRAQTPASGGRLLLPNEDAYEAQCHHVLLYDRHAGCLVGACRLGLGRPILHQRGRPGLGLHPLVRFKKALLPVLRQAVEVSGVFIRAEYQAQPLPQVLMWLGLAAFLSERPHYRYLIGSVRLPPAGSSLPPAQVLKVIKRHCYDAELAAAVRVRKPFRYRPRPGLVSKVLPAGAQSGAVFDALLTGEQPGGLGLPKALRPYFRRHLRFLGFHRSPADHHDLQGVALLDADAFPAWAQHFLCPAAAPTA